MNLDNKEHNYLTDITEIKDLFSNKSFISVFNDFLFTMTDRKIIESLIKNEIDNIENILDDIFNFWENKIALSEKELFVFVCSVFSNNLLLASFIDFISINWDKYITDTTWFDKDLFVFFSKKDVNFLLDIIQYSLNIFSKRKNYEIDLIETRIKDKVDNIIWVIDITEPSIVLSNLWFPSIIKKENNFILVKNVFKESVIEINWIKCIQIEDVDLNKYFITEEWNVLKLNNWRFLSEINKKYITDWYWLLMQITDDFRNQYVVLNGEVFDANYDREFDDDEQKWIWIMNDFSIRKFNFDWKQLDFYEMQTPLIKKIFNKDFEIVTVASVLELLWFDLDNDNILDSTYMFLDENLISLEKFYDFDWLKFAKIKVRKQAEFSTVTFMSEEEREEYVRKERFFSFIIWSNWKILMSWEWNIVYDLLSKENILWKELISYTNWPDNIVDWYIDWNSNFITLDWELIYQIDLEHLSFTDDRVYKINNKHYIRESKLINTLNNFSWLNDTSFQIFFNNDDKVTYKWNLVDELSVVLKWENQVVFRVNYLWETLWILSYNELVKEFATKKDLLKFINETLKKIS